MLGASTRQGSAMNSNVCLQHPIRPMTRVCVLMSGLLLQKCGRQVFTEANQGGHQKKDMGLRTRIGHWPDLSVFTGLGC